MKAVRSLLIPSIIILIGTVFGTGVTNAFADDPFVSGVHIHEAKKSSEVQQQQDLQTKAGPPQSVPPKGVSNIADNSVTSESIKDGEVKSQDLADAGVTGDKIADGAVSGDKIADGAVSGDKIADGAVSGDKIAD